MAEAPPEGLERRDTTIDMVANVPGFPGLELAVRGIEASVEGVAETVPSDCECGHGADAHSEALEDSGNTRTVRRECTGITLVEEERASGYDAADGMQQAQCPCREYTPAHEPREIAFRVERLLEVGGAPKARLRRKGEVVGEAG